MPKFATVSDIYDESRPWQWRAVRASMGTTTGLIVMAMVGVKPKHGTSFGTTCDIGTDGVVDCDVKYPGAAHFRRIKIGTIQDVRDNVRRLADHCRFNDKDREAMFTELKRWVRKDHRAVSEA